MLRFCRGPRCAPPSPLPPTPVLAGAASADSLTGALHALVHQPVQQGAAVVAEGRAAVAVQAELVLVPGVLGAQRGGSEGGLGCLNPPRAALGGPPPPPAWLSQPRPGSASLSLHASAFIEQLLCASQALFEVPGPSREPKQIKSPVHLQPKPHFMGKKMKSFSPKNQGQVSQDGSVSASHSHQPPRRKKRHPHWKGGCKTVTIHR